MRVWDICLDYDKLKSKNYRSSFIVFRCSYKANLVLKNTEKDW